MGTPVRKSKVTEFVVGRNPVVLRRPNPRESSEIVQSIVKSLSHELKELAFRALSEPGMASECGMEFSSSRVEFQDAIGSVRVMWTYGMDVQEQCRHDLFLTQGGQWVRITSSLRPKEIMDIEWYEPDTLWRFFALENARSSAASSILFELRRQIEYATNRLAKRSEVLVSRANSLGVCIAKLNSLIPPTGEESTR